MEKDYDNIIRVRADEVINAMAARSSAEDIERLRRAFDYAREAHASQKRKTGEPYILHPIAVARIAATELDLDVNSVIAAFLHDVVEDTDRSLEDIRRRFGDDVAFLVNVVTKQKKERYTNSKQVDNFRQMLDSVQYDIRAILVKLADRLHNMRTLSSMKPDKQMKIAGETDYFYAPLANRLGLYAVKTELENLSFRFRCPHEYDELVRLIANDERAQHDRLAMFAEKIKQVLDDAGFSTRVYVEYRPPYSIWRKMHKYGDDFNHLKYRHFTDIVYKTPEGTSEKDMALRIYSVLTDVFKEKPGGIINYIDSPKENGYQSFHVKLLADFGRWQEVHISSERMVRDSRIGCMAQRSEDNIARWIDKFRGVLRDIAEDAGDGKDFIERVATSFYNDDIMTFTRNGRPVVMPQHATVLDFAYELGDEIGEHAKYGRLNNFLASIKAPLRRGDVVEVFTDPECHPSPDWLDVVVTYKARKAITEYLAARPCQLYCRCPECRPIPEEEVIGFRDPDGRITLHKRDCKTAIRLATQHGDDILSVDFEPDHDTLYPVTIAITAIDRYHLFIDIVECITNTLRLTMNSFNTHTVDSIVTITINFSVHSAREVETIIHHVEKIDGVDEVKRIADSNP
ncbi:MAG: bifunctional (p)ppGpp synthetase/guanosine-3',5'-bis(diphosphate) 3'-pyrophosphohydrolase [Bacteroidales bacterium]|nr:bifunctional (p)ppGpp synthetase/guanosine-3',5'-bis(diphosphate) 3'-pyrophosphohydrolase [Bacteroidales bacterium]MBD5219674.1 bifunctional (p)ppGpp synthetase/guanosine-3',5'-bis(diphosphate) 3'-pyrophosphohydrolase [Bacteroidales bacterium]MDE6437391.1 HD domain-containing protein [Muribaculaceae bacterium]